MQEIEEIDESTLRPIFDPASTRQSIMDRTKGAFESKFPLENDKVRIELSNVDYTGKKSFGIHDTKKALMEGRRLSVPLHGDVRLVDKVSGQVLDEKKKHLLANVPYMTDRGTFVNKGTEYVVVNQSRLRPGIYARRKDNGELESHINVKPGTGTGMRMFMEPDTGVYRVKVGDSQIKLLPILQRLGVEDDELKSAWGPDVFEANRAASDERAFDKFYDRLVGARGAAYLRRLREAGEGSKKAASLDPEQEEFFSALTEAIAKEARDEIDVEDSLREMGWEPTPETGGYAKMVAKAAQVFRYEEEVQKEASLGKGIAGGALVGGGLGAAGGLVVSAIQKLRVEEMDEDGEKRKDPNWLKNTLVGAGLGAVGGGAVGGVLGSRDTSGADVVNQEGSIDSDASLLGEEPADPIRTSDATASTRPKAEYDRNRQILNDPRTHGDTITRVEPVKGPDPDRLPTFEGTWKWKNSKERFEHIGDFTPSQFKGNYGDQLDTEIAKARDYAKSVNMEFDYDKIYDPASVYRIKDSLREEPRIFRGSRSVVESSSKIPDYQTEILLDSDGTEPLRNYINHSMGYIPRGHSRKYMFGSPEVPEDFEEGYFGAKDIEGEMVINTPEQNLDEALTEAWVEPSMERYDDSVSEERNGRSWSSDGVVNDIRWMMSTSPDDVANWASRLQHAQYGLTGKRLESPQEVQALVDSIINTPDTADFEKKLNAYPSDVRGFFRDFRRMNEDPDVDPSELEKLKKFFRNVTPALVHTFKPEGGGGQPGMKLASDQNDDLFWGEDPMVPFMMEAQKIAGFQKEAAEEPQYADYSNVSPAQGMHLYPEHYKQDLGVAPQYQMPKSVWDSFLLAERGPGERKTTTDSGGVTLDGVARSSGIVPAEEIPNLTEQQVRNIWDNIYANEIHGIQDPGAARAALDLRATAGPGVYAKALQRSLNRLDPDREPLETDGVYGSGTRERLMAIEDQSQLGTYLLDETKKHQEGLVSKAQARLNELKASDPEAYKAYKSSHDNYTRYQDGWANRRAGVKSMLTPPAAKQDVAVSKPSASPEVPKAPEAPKAPEMLQEPVLAKPKPGAPFTDETAQAPTGLQKEGRVIMPARKTDFNVAIDALEEARKRVDPTPTEKQKEKGNFSKGHVRWNGLDIAIENPKGGTRSGIDRNGNSWSTKMKADYGYIKGTRGKDKDCLDVFLGPDLDSEVVFVVDQLKKPARKQTQKKGELSCTHGMLQHVEEQRDDLREAWNEKTARVPGVATDEGEVPQPPKQEVSLLWGQGDQSVPKLAGQLQEVYRGHGASPELGDDNRAEGQRRELLSGELRVGASKGAEGQPQELHKVSIPREGDVVGGAGGGVGNFSRNTQESDFQAWVERGEGDKHASGGTEQDLETFHVSGSSDANECVGSRVWDQALDVQESGQKTGSRKSAGDDSGHPWWDECKCLLGFKNRADAKAAYLSCYQDGWECGPIIAMTVDEFKWWCFNGDMETPCSEQHTPKFAEDYEGWVGVDLSVLAEGEKKVAVDASKYITEHGDRTVVGQPWIKHLPSFFPKTEGKSMEFRVHGHPRSFIRYSGAENPLGGGPENKPLFDRMKAVDPSLVERRLHAGGALSIGGSDKTFIQEPDEATTYRSILGPPRDSSPLGSIGIERTKATPSADLLPQGNIYDEIKERMKGVESVISYGCNGGEGDCGVGPEFYERMSPSVKEVIMVPKGHLGSPLSGLTNKLNKPFEWFGATMGGKDTPVSGLHRYVKNEGGEWEDKGPYEPVIDKFLRENKKTIIWTAGAIGATAAATGLVLWGLNRKNKKGEEGEDTQAQKEASFEPDVTCSVFFKEASDSHEGWVAMDLDGVLAHSEGEFDPDSVGEPIPEMVQLAQDLKNSGRTVKILTARAADPKNISVVEDWLAENGLGDTEVTNEKDPGMMVLFDDKAVEVAKNEGLPAKDIEEHFENFKAASLDEMKELKTLSDQRRYGEKHALARRLMEEDPDAYFIDSDDGRGIVGVTHRPTGFRWHMPKGQLGLTNPETGSAKTAVIKHEDGKWKLYTKDGSRVLGTHDSKQKAIKQEYAIEKSQEQKKSAEYKLYYFEGRNTGIAARSEEEARKKKRRGGDKLVKVRTPNDSEQRDMDAGRWVRTRADGKPPGKSKAEGEGYGPKLKKKASDMLTNPNAVEPTLKWGPTAGYDGGVQLTKLEARAGDNKIGEVFVRQQPDLPYDRITNLFVADSHRGQGIGRSLMEKAIGDFGKERELRLRATPGFSQGDAPKQDDLVNFYSQLGFITFDDKGNMKRPAPTSKVASAPSGRAADFLIPQNLRDREKASDMLIFGREAVEKTASDHEFDIGALTSGVMDALNGKQASDNAKQDIEEELTPDDRVDLVRMQLERMEIDPEISMRNLGAEHKNVGAPALIDASRKLLMINRGEALPDDRDSKANQTFHSVDDFLEERIMKDAGRVGGTLLGRAGWQGSLKALKVGHFTPQLDGLIVSNSLSQAVPGINPIELMDIGQKITQMGEGGIPSMDAVPKESRNVHVSQVGLIDPVRTPESSGVGIDQRISSYARKGPNQQLYMPLIDRRTGKRVWRTPSQVYGKTMLFPRRVPMTK